MALQKTKKLNNGVEGNYWRIIRINCLIRNGAEVLLGLFLDKKASDKGCEPICVETKQMSVDKELLIKGNAMEYAYKRAKESCLDEGGNETNFFVDASDC